MSSLPRYRRIASNLLLHRGELLRNPIVEVDKQGEIISVEHYRDGEVDRMANTEFYAGIMCAGFVNAHCHLELSYLKGEIEEGRGFAHFASQIGRVRSQASIEDRVAAIKLADHEMMQSGVVAVGDIVNGDSSYATKESSKITYHSFAELFGLNTHDTSSVDKLLQYERTSLTPHSLYSLNDSIFRQIVEQQQDDTPLSIHFMESPDEKMLYEGQGALHDWYGRAGFNCDFLHYGSPAERLISCVPADRSVMLVHCCMVQQRDIDLVMEHFRAPVYWVLSPRSNHYISRISPPVELLRKSGLNICIGTDSLASNHSLSIIEELSMFRRVPLGERLDWATRQGAAALQISHLGEITVGKRPGINIISNIDYSAMEITKSTQVQRIVYNK